jgi:hypothetical protein
LFVWPSGPGRGFAVGSSKNRSTCLLARRFHEVRDFFLCPPLDREAMRDGSGRLRPRRIVQTIRAGLEVEIHEGHVSSDHV